jgi:hypothetical protein
MAPPRPVTVTVTRRQHDQRHRVMAPPPVTVTVTRPGASTTSGTE